MATVTVTVTRTVTLTVTDFPLGQHSVSAHFAIGIENINGLG